MLPLLLNLVFGAIGSAYLVYGRRQTSAAFAVAGVLLMLFPWFVEGAALTAIVGAALLAAPFLVNRWWF